MHPRKFALIGGSIMLAMGILAFVPSLSQLPPQTPFIKYDVSYGEFLGFLPMNVVNKVLLILFGVAGIFSSRAENRSLPASINFSRTVFYFMGIAAILGVLGSTQTLFGYAPLFGGEVWTHGIFAIIGAYFGYAFSVKLDKERPHYNPKDANGHVHGL